MNDNIKYYYVDANNKSVGPLTYNEFLSLHLPKGTKVWHTGFTSWVDYNPAEFQSRKVLHAIKVNKKIVLYSVIALFVVLIIWLLVSFSHSTNQKHQIIEGAYDCEEFDMYLQKYYRDLEYFGISKRKPRTIIMKLAHMQYFDNTKDYHGISYGYKDDDIIEIYINEDSWKRLSRPQKYWLMYHELSHDILNVDDLPNKPENYGKLMSPFMVSFDKISMDDFIEMSHELFENY